MDCLGDVLLDEKCDVRSRSGAWRAEEVTGLQSFGESAIKRFRKQLQKGKTLVSALKTIGFHTVFDSNVINWLARADDEMIDSEMVLLMYHGFAWICGPKTVHTNYNAGEIFSVLNRQLKCETFTSQRDLLMHEVVNVCKEIAHNDVTQPVLQYVLSNPSIGGWFYETFVNIVMLHARVTEVDDGAYVVGVIAKLFGESRKMLENSDLSKLSPLLVREMNRLNRDTVYILCKWSEREPTNYAVNRLMALIPGILFGLVCQNRCSCTRGDMFLDKSVLAECVIDDDRESLLQTPTLELVKNRGKLSDFIPMPLMEILDAALPWMKQFTSEAVNALVVAFYGIKCLVSSDDYFNFLLVSVIVLSDLKITIDTSELCEILWNETVFAQNECVFGEKGFTSWFNCLRNAIVKFTAKRSPAFLQKQLIGAAAKPLFFAEILMRLSVLRGDVLPPDFYRCNTMIMAVVEASSIQQNDFVGTMQNFKYAQAVIFELMFRLVRSKESAEMCLADETFAAGFLPLIFVDSFAGVCIDVFSNALIHLSRLPEPVVRFLLSFFGSCNQEGRSEPTRNVIDLFRCLCKALSVNNKLVSDFNIIVDDALTFLRLLVSDDILNDTLAILAYIYQSRSVKRLSNTRWNAIVDIVQINEEKEPSDATYRKLLSILHGSTNLSSDSFVIMNAGFLPILLTLFCKSERLPNVLELMCSLCEYSEANAHAMHDGDVSLMLLKGVMGTFSYRGREITMLFGEASKCVVKRSVIPLLCAVLSVRSSYGVDRALIDSVLCKSSGNVSTIMLEFLSTLLARLSRDRVVHKLALPVRRTNPLFSCKLGKEGQECPIHSGLGLVMNLKLDRARARGMIQNFVLLRIDDGCRKFMLCYSSNGAYATYTSDKYMLRTPIIRGINVSGWISVSIMIAPVGSMYVLACDTGTEMREEFEFKNLEFTYPVTIDGGYLVGDIIPMCTSTPVVIDSFHLFSSKCHELCEEENENDIEKETRHLILSSSSPEVRFSPCIVVGTGSLITSLLSHFTVHDLLQMFCRVDRPLDAKQVLTVASKCLKCSMLTKHSLVHASDYTYLVCGIDEDNAPLDLSGAGALVSLSPVIAIPVICLVNSPDLLTFSLYESFYDMMVAIDVKWVAQEILKWCMLNIWLWCESVDFDRIARHWVDVVLTNHHKDGLFETGIFSSLLIQGHYVVHTKGSKLKPGSEFPGFRFKIMNKLIKFGDIPFTPVDVNALFSVMEAVHDNHAEFEEYMGLVTCAANVRTKVLDVHDIGMLIQLVSHCDVILFKSIFNVLEVIGGENRKSRVSSLAFTYFDTGAEDVPVDCFDLLCVRAIFYEPKSFEFVKDPQMREGDDFWYFWPVALGMCYDQAVSDVVTAITERVDEFNLILSFFDILVARRLMNAASLRDRYIGALLEKARDRNDFTHIFVRCFASLFWRFKRANWSEFLQERIVDEVPHEWNFVPEIEHMVDSGSMSPKDRVLSMLNIIRVPVTSDLTFCFDAQKTEVNMSGLIPEHATSAIMTFIRRLLDRDTRQATDPCPSENIHITIYRLIAVSLLRMTQEVRMIGDLISDDRAVTSVSGLVVIQKCMWNAFIENGVHATARIEKMPVPEEMNIVHSPLCLIDRVRKPASGKGMREYKIIKGQLLGDNIENCEFNFQECIVTLLRCDKDPAVIHAEMILYIVTESDVVPLMMILRNGHVYHIATAMHDTFVRYCEGALGIMPVKASALRDICMEMWKHDILANFGYLVMLGILAGHSFDLSCRSPILPVLGDDPPSICSLSKVSDADMTMHADLDVSASESNSLWFPPEFFCKSSDTELLQLVRKNRAMLESSEVTRNLHIWTDVQFHVSCRKPAIHRYNLVSDKPLTVSMGVKSVDYSGHFGPHMSLFFVFSENKSICVYEIDTQLEEGCRLVKSVQRPYTFLTSIVVGARFVIACDPGRLSFIRIDLDGTMTAAPLLVHITSILALCDAVIYVVDYHSVYIANEWDFPSKGHLLYTEKDKIMEMVADRSGFIVMLTQSGKITAVTMTFPHKLCEIDVSQKEVHGLCVTRNWNLIVFEMDHAIHVYSIHGNKICQTRGIWKDLKFIRTFSFSDGHTFVIVVDDMSIRAFDVFEPDRIVVVGSCNHPIISLYRLTGLNKVVVIDNIGGLLFIEFPLKECIAISDT